MKKIHSLLSEQNAKTTARALKFVCYMAMLFLVFCMIVSAIGRQTFILQTSTGTYDNAIYAEESHDWTSRGLTVYIGDEIRVTTDQKIDFITHVGMSAMYFIAVAPMIICFWLLAKVFDNIGKGYIFTEQNANFLLYYGLIGIVNAFASPFIKLFICYFANLFTDSKISISTGSNSVTQLFPHVAFLVAAYIIHYGVNLQDEADHTL